MTDEEKNDWNHQSTLSTFANEPSEIHAISLGVFAAFRRVRPGHVPKDYPEKNRDEIFEEYPYYLGGFYLGRVIQFIVFVILGMLFY